MKTLELRTEIHELIDKVDDKHLLNAIKMLLSKGINSEWWEDLSAEEKHALEEGLKESEDRNLIPHNVVMEEIKEKYRHNK